MPSKFDLVVIGTSAGGVTAVQAILQSLSRQDFLTPILVAQHLPPYAVVDIALVFGRFYNNRVVEARDKIHLENHHAYLSTPGYHLLVERDRTLALSQDDPVHYSRPSIDVLFESAAKAYQSAVIGVLLTGANEDGAEGLELIQKHKGYTIVQNPETAEVGYMPAQALQRMEPDQILDLEDIPNCLVRLCKGIGHGQN